MKKLFGIMILLAALPLGMSAGKHGNLQTAPALNVSLSACVAGELVSFSGSGYGANGSVTIEVQGPTSLTLYANADSLGNISGEFSAPFASGYYYVSSYITPNKKMNFMASTGFEVQ
jgi:hypothetical protein